MEPGPLSLAPVLLSLVLALALRQVLFGLFAGVLLGTALLTPEPHLGLVASVFRDQLRPQLMDGYNASVILLLAVIGSFVALLERSGGAQAFAESAVQRLKGVRQLQLGAYGGGLLIFFSDLGTPLILGPIFRPLFDRAGLLRERLALILDATAAPIAILVPFIGWGVYIMSLVAQTPPGAGPEAPYTLLLDALPFQFYAWLALALIPVLAFTGGHFGRSADASRPLTATDAATGPGSHHPWQGSLLWAPLAVLGIALFAMLGPEGFPFAPLPGADFRAGLAAAYALATATLVVLALALRILPFARLMESAITGATRMTPVVATLLMAWTLADLGEALGAPRYVAETVLADFPVTLLPAAAFLLGALISFATGSSWGTFALLIPLLLPAAASLEGPVALTLAAILSGGLFGDHASPLSETTILAASGAELSTFEHFRHQWPYATVNGALALGAFLVAGAMPEPWLLLPLLLLQGGVWIMLLRRSKSRP
ncbi:MAG: Na+/H+ antiporter NhaC family protein [Pseudomonadales bacterium]|jgi:Na+/H+ antiporter NhaC